MRMIRLIRLSCGAGMLIFLAGCASTVKLAYNPGPISDPPVHLCPVSLELSRDFCEFQHTTPGAFLVHGSFSATLGPSLREYAIYVAKSHFGDVELLDSQSPRKSSKLLLKPHVVSCDLQPAIDISSPASGALSVQWIFQDPQTRQTLFTLPIQCEYMHKPTLFAGQPLSTVAAGMMTNLTATTLYRFKQSKEIERFTGP